MVLNAGFYLSTDNKYLFDAIYFCKMLWYIWLTVTPMLKRTKEAIKDLFKIR